MTAPGQVEQDADDGAEVEQEGGEATEWAPPSQEEWERTQAALKKANAEARKNRLKVKAAAEGVADQDAEREITARVEAKMKPVVVRAAARAAFAEAGMDAKAVSRAFRLLDLDDVTIDEDGEVSGLAEQVEEIREEFPGMFAAKPGARPRTGKVDAGRTGGESTKPKTSAQILTEQMFGRS